MNTEQLCNHIVHLIHMPIHVYDEEGAEIAVYIDNGEQQDVMNCDSDLRHIILEKSRLDYPVLHLEIQEIIYGIVRDKNKTYVMGPCCLGHTEADAARYMVKTHHMNSRKPYKIFFTPLEAFCEMVIMLYETAVGKEISREELMQKNFCDKQMFDSMQEKLHKVFINPWGGAAFHNPYNQELHEQEAIQKGDIDALKKSSEESFAGKYGTLSHSSLRNAKNMGIVVIALACRSAIAGGMLPEVAFSMSDAFIQRSEEMKNPVEVWAFIRQAEMEYCKAVRELNNRDFNQNPLIKRCKNIVLSQLHSKLTVKDIAIQLGIRPDYLSHLFQQEERLKLTDYIICAKIEEAKKQLVYTKHSLDVIAHSFGFVSQSHFGQSFKKWTDMTPKQYRSYYSRKLEKEK